MARPIEHDRNTVLELGMLQFWRDGYEGTSISKLIEVCGIHRGTMYASFGEKETFFKQCLAHYNEKLAALFERSLGNTTYMAKPALEAFFMDAIEHMTKTYAPGFKHGLGCLVVNVAGESIMWDTRFNHAIKVSLEYARDALRLRVKELAGVPGSGREWVEATTDQLMALYCGLSTQARLGKNAKQLKLLANRTLHPLQRT